MWDHVTGQVEQHRKQLAADWLEVEYCLRAMALLAVLCAVSCHK